MTEIALNGKWLAQPVTGTQRYALEITRHLLDLLPRPVTIHVPRDAVVPDWVVGRARVRRSRLTGTVFEQVALPWAARGQLLVSLGGVAPLLARRQVATIHDVTPFRFPRTYGRLFRLWYRTLYRGLARRAELLVTVSRFSARELTAVLGVRPGRIVIAPNGCDHVDGVDARRPELPGLPGAPGSSGPAGPAGSAEPAAGQRSAAASASAPPWSWTPRGRPAARSRPGWPAAGPAPPPGQPASAPAAAARPTAGRPRTARRHR